jgi:DNA polymerase III subunit delta'
MRFSEIKGNYEIKRKLIQTVLDQRVSHAQLFFGPGESQKLALAIAYAQFINCTGRVLSHTLAEHVSPGDDANAVAEEGTPGILTDSCGTCPSCVKFQKLVHPDLHFIYPVATTKKVPKKPQSKHFIGDWRNFLIDNNFQSGLQDWYEAIGIENKQGIINADDCNEIITTLGYKSYESDYKVMIIWMVEKLYYAAAPKILKILEEPPEKTLFILVSEEPGQIIKTILSRTQMVKIPKSGSLQPGSAEEDAYFYETFRQWMLDCYQAKIPELIGFAGEMAKTGREKQKTFLIYALKIIGFCASLNYRSVDPAGVEGEELTFIRRFSQYIKPDNLLAFNTLLNEAIYNIERNAHAPTLFLDLSLKIVRQFKPNFIPL